MPIRSLSSWRPIALCAVAAGAAAGGWAWYQSTADYVSKGVLVAKRALLPQPILATEPITNLDVNRAATSLLSRASLANLIHTHDLYTTERTVQPLEDVIEQMRKDIKVEPASDDGWRVIFRYRDALKAQRVNQAILAGMVDELKRQRSARIDHAAEFIESRRAKLSGGPTARAVARPVDPAGLGRHYGPVGIPTAELAPVSLAADRIANENLDPAQVRREQELLERQLAMIRIWKDLEERREGPRLDILEPALFPLGNLVQQYLPWSMACATALGLLSGGLMSTLVAAAYRLARGSQPIA